MTLNDIIVSALAQLDRGSDTQTVEIYRERLTRYANDAQNDLAWTLGLTRTDGVKSTHGILDLNTLQRNCIRVEKVVQHDHEVPFRMGDKPNILLLPYDAPAEVTYRYQPEPLASASDVSELGEDMHPLIVTYVVGRERMGGDVSTQSGGNIYLSMYNSAKQKLRGYLKNSDSFKITNRY